MNKLDPESESPATERLGRIYIHHVGVQPSPDPDDACDINNSFPGRVQALDCAVMEELECAAVLDMKWKEANLAVATAGGSLQIYAYAEDDRGDHGPPASDSSRLLSLRSEIVITDGLALALGTVLYQ